MTVEQLQQRIDLDPQRMGFVLHPIKRQGLAASLGATPFEWLFLGFSSFIIASAAMLVALLFGLGIVRRGHRDWALAGGRIPPAPGSPDAGRRGFLGCGGGSLVGVFAGIGYAWLMLAGLQSLVAGGRGHPFLAAGDCAVKPRGGLRERTGDRLRRHRLVGAADRPDCS